MAFKREKALAAAQKYAAKGQHEKAAREFQSIVDNDPKDLRAWLMLADALNRSGKPDDAIARYLQVGKAFQEKKDYSKALAVYRQLLTLDPRRIDVHLKCAQLHTELRQIPDAVSIYERVGKVYLKQDRAKDAIELFKRAADLDPKAVTRRLRLAELYSREGMNDEAVGAFRIAGQALLDESKHEEYVRVAERLLYHKEDDRETILGVVRAYIKLRQPRRALVKLNGLLQKDPADVEGLELLCETFVRLGKVDKAVSVILEIVREHATGPEGEAMAKRVLERGLEWAPKHEELRSAYDALHGAPEPEPAPVEAPAESEPAFELDDDEDDDPFGDLDEDEDDGIELVEMVELDADEVEEIEEFEEFEEVDDFDEFGDDSTSIELDDDDDDDEFADTGVETPSVVDRDLTGEVMSGVGRRAAPSHAGDESIDFDLQLQEAKVLAKYRLYDNALAHIAALLEQEPRHLGALELRAELLARAERPAEHAKARLALAQLLAGSDPARAGEEAQKAVDADPTLEAAQKLLRELGPATAVAAIPAEVEIDQSDVAAFEELALEDDEDEEDEGDFIELPSADESSDFAIDVDDDDEDEEPEDEDFPIEDRFGLPEESAELPIGGISDISEEVEEIEGLLAMGQEDAAEKAFLRLAATHAGHPALSSLSERFADKQEAEREEGGAAAQPLFDFTDDDEGEDYLAGIFEEPAQTPAEDDEVEHRGRAKIEGGADAATHYDLGTAYHGMGLAADAIGELEKAAADPAWTCRACILMATVHQQLSNDLAAARDAAARAAEAAGNADERSESNYLLGELLLELGDHDQARAAFEAVSPGFRDREAKLAIL